ncbi:MAG: type II toxin-antitoxin system RelE/ParE family toxin [Alphaproteobacteria bacterium]|jgi:putative addiction module killer protein|nr:type II toxin-antitoxin system RelE/ParE family toxin [Alphaproteobacteria bacterium]MBP9877657.1 type II toxin-antitoxin system RelE/ParE family toxin [Alphaproteobacteria bacterium]
MWVVEYYKESGIESWLDNLTIEQLKAVAKEVKFLELSGNRLRLPHSKSLKKGLFELRERRFGYRIYYTFRGDKIILLICAGDKSTQEKDIKKAQRILDHLREKG